MKTNDQVWYSVSRKINIGNYESMGFELGESRTVQDKQNPDEVYTELRKAVNARLGAILKKLEEKNDA